MVGTENGGTITRIALYTPQTDSFINEAAIPCATTSGSTEIARTESNPQPIDFSGVKLTGVQYARIYLANASGSAVDPTGLLTVTYGGNTATAAGTDAKNGLYVYDGGNDLTLSNISVTLNAGAGNFINYKIVCLLSNDISTATPSDGSTPLTQEPKWQEEYTYSFTYPVYEQRFDLDESILNETMVEIDNNGYYRDLILTHYGKTANQIKDNWYGRWYVTDESGNRQNLALGTANGTNWVITPRNENEGQNWNTYSWSVADNIAYTNEEGRKNDWFVNQSLCRGRIYAPSSSTFQNYGGYKLIFEATDDYTSGTPNINVRFIFSIPSTVVFEGEANTGAVADATGTQKVNVAAASVNLDLTNKALAHSKVASADIKYARFYLTDAEGTIVDPTGKLTVKYNGTTISANCPKANQGFYVYDNGNTLDKTKFEVTLTTPNAYTDYKVVALFAVDPLQNIVESSGTVSEEPDYDLKYTYSFANIEFEYSGTVTNTPITQQFANATDDDTTATLDWSLIDNLPSGIKYARFYVLDASGNAVDASDAAHLLTVSNGSLCDNHTNGYYVYTGSDLTLGNVTLTSNGGSVLPYRVVCWIATSETGIYKDGNTVLEEPDITNGYVYSFRKPVQHTEKTGTVEWSPASMAVTLDIDALKGSGYKVALGSNYHVVWTVEDASSSAQALTTGTERQAGTWTYSTDGDNATFYAPTGQTFADVQNMNIVARLYETATGENDADKSLTYTVSITRTEFLGTLKGTGNTDSETVTLEDGSAATVDVPLSHATLSGAKYARVWLTQGGTMVSPAGKLSVPTGMNAFGTNHDATYGYYLYDENGITLTDVTLAAPGSYTDYQVHVALSVDAPISYADFARTDSPRRAPADAYEPDYDYEYTISFQDNSMKVIKIYVQASDSEGQVDYPANLQSTVVDYFTEQSWTLNAENCFAKWDVIKDGNLVPFTAWNASVQFTDGNNFAHNVDDNKKYIYSAGSNSWEQSTLAQTLNQNLRFPVGKYQLGSVVELWVTNENSHTAADPAGGYKLKVEIHFNEDGNPPYTFVNVTDIAATKQMVNVSTLASTNPLLDMSDALVDGAKYARFYLTHYGMEADESSALNISYNGTAATACASPYGRYGYYLSSDDAFNLENLIVSTSLTPDQLMQYQLVVVSSTNPLSGDQEPAWEKKTVISFQKEIRERIYADDNNYLAAINKQADILSRLGASSAGDFSKSLYARWYLLNPANEEQVIASGNGSWDYKWYFEILNSGIGNWTVTDDNRHIVIYTDKDQNCSSDQIESNRWPYEIGLTTKIHVSQTQTPPTATSMDYVGWKVIFEISDEYDTATNGATPDYRLRYVFTISDPNAFTGDANTGAAEVEVTQTVNRTAESINLTLQDNNNYNTTWPFEHQKLTQRQWTWYGGWQTIETPVRYARFYLTDYEGNLVDPTGKLTVTYGGDNATVTSRETAPEQGFYVFGEGGTEIQRNQLTISLAAPREYKLYKVVCLFSTALDGIEPADLTTPLQREPDYDLKYTYSFDYPTPTTKVINITIPWSKTGMTLRANTDADGDLLTSTSVDDAWGISFPELSAGQYVRWYVERQQGGPAGNQRQELVAGSERVNGAWALNAASVYQFLDRTNQRGGDQAYLTGRTDFTDANWDNVWSSPTIYAPTGMNFDGPNGAQNCRFICEVYADDDDSGTPYVRYIFTMERFLGDLKDDGREGSETIIIPKETTFYDVPLDNIYSALNIPANEKIVYARVWLTKADGTPVVPNGLTWTQMYNGSNQVGAPRKQRNLRLVFLFCRHWYTS